MNKILSVLMAILISISTFFFGHLTGDYKHDEEVVSNCPFVFVGGYLFYGPTSSVRGVYPQWGMGSCDLIKELNSLGYECLESSLGPFSSAWDRSCELYANLTGTTVDYGEAHSKAHNHKRYGKTYDKPLYESFGEVDENGNYKKINLLGHSFGGTTVNLFVSLLSEGDSREKETTKDGTLSPLFEGGKSEWINSIIDVASPNNGTTLYNIAQQKGILSTVEYTIYYIANMTDYLDGIDASDFQLEHFGIERNPDERLTDFIFRAVDTMITTYKNDSGLYDMSIDGAKAINERCKIQNNIYYYTLPYCVTNPDENGNQVVEKGTFPVLKYFGDEMGKLKENNYNSIPVTDEWLANDGLTNTISERNPFNQPYTDFDYTMTPEKGIWNVFPVARGNHGSMIGLDNTKKNVLDFFIKLFDFVGTYK